MKSKKTDKIEFPIVRIDNSLKEKYKNIVFNQEKLDEANETLKKYKLPDEFYNKEKP